MILNRVMAFVVVTSLTVMSGNALSADPLPKGDLTENARGLYNNGDYEDALDLFIKLARQHPKNRAVYRALAASANNAKSYHTAVRAYEIYLELDPESDDAEKVRAELKNVRRQTNDKGRSKRKSINSAIKNLEQALEKQRLLGPNGALFFFKTLRARKYFGPKFGEYEAAVWQQFQDGHEALIRSYWDTVEILDVEILSDFIDACEVAKQIFTRTDKVQTIENSIKIMVAFNDGNTRQALTLLERNQIRDYRLRYLMAMQLFKARRTSESIALLQTLHEQYQKPRMRIRAEMIKLKSTRKVSSSALDELLEAVDALPEPSVPTSP